MVRTFYVERLDQWMTHLKSLKRWNPLFLTLELLFFILFLISLYVYLFEIKNSWILSVSVVSIVIYAVIVCKDRANSRKISKVRRMTKVIQNELNYLDGDYSSFEDGAGYMDASHSYSTDMVLFGTDSLFHRINRTVTLGGSDMLAAMLTHLPSTATMVHDRRDSINELSRMTDVRLSFLSSVDKKIDTGKTKILLETASQVKFSQFFSSTVAYVLIRLVTAILLLSIILSVFTSLSPNVPITLSVLMLTLSLTVSSQPLNKVSRIVNKMSKDFASYSSLLSTLSHSSFESTLNRDIYTQLFTDDVNSEKAFRELEQLLKSIDRRGNILGLVFANALFCNDISLVRRFITWQKKYLHRLPLWFDAISRMDAMMSLATLRFNTPEGCDPEVVECDSIVYDVSDIWHPFIPESKAVKNSFMINDGSFYIITGANMAGKSTFLRSIGINYILAMNGTVAFASSMRVSVFNLFTSMSTTDDLTHGISYFNAELLRLKQLIDSCRKASHTLIILDEILKGTNSLDKLNGSRMFLQSISSLPVSGIIATHDLELSKMQEDDSRRFINYCFEVELSDSVTYSYRITPGVARNQNATFLLKKILIP
jgi:DNA mismatch repair ATPase MutS